MATLPQHTPPKKPLAQAVIIAAVSVTVLAESPPFYFGGYDLIKYVAYGGLVVGVPPLLIKSLDMLAGQFEKWEARITTGLKGTAAWGTSLKDLGEHVLKPSLFKTGHGPYWGCLKKGIFGFGRQAAFAPITAVALICGISGSGKDVTVLLPNIFSTGGSKMILDFDGSTACIVKDELERRGERVHLLNFDDTFGDILGASDCYNHLHMIADSFERKGGILDVSADSTELANILYPEPETDGEGGNRHFRDGSRTLLKFAMVMMVLIKGRDACMADVLALIQDRESLKFHALWAAGTLEVDTPETPQTLEVAND